MTAEANSRISSISGSNLNTISGSADSKNGGTTRKQTPTAAPPTTNIAPSKRNNHPIKTDEIEVQVADQNSATNPPPLSKVSILKINSHSLPYLVILFKLP